MKPKIVLGLSGGVDSAVSAMLLKENYDVHCLWLDIGLGVGGEDAAAVAEKMGLPFQKADIRANLEHYVCEPFVSDYLAGRTPLPCARCNPLVKFPALAAEAERVGAEFVATGHYARTAAGPDGRVFLRKGKSANDQSYMLSRLTQNLLRRIVFPLGNYEKTEVRALAEKAGIQVAHKPDSMEICFIPGGDYAAWLDERAAPPPAGDFVSPEGIVLGRHKGIHHYTLGQSRGLGISGPHRYYVSRIDPETNTVTLSDGSDLFVTGVRCVRPNWIMLEELTEPMDVTVRLRHSKTETPAVIYPAGSHVDVEMKEPARAPTPGQLAVFYQGDLVVGSAWIERGG
ncbi:MAG: tRNA 2-thiouridine(34) synthase MnmA [Clostridia bacterium]|nr:tRNA 2-thiouridine(34) synthase MnmA [Clostridia bacterium]